MRNIIGVIFGYLSFTASLAAAYALSGKLLQFLGSIFSTGWIMIVIMLLVFSAVFEIPYKLSAFVSCALLTKKPPMIIVAILMIMEIIFRQYQFYVLNGFAWWFVLAGVLVIFQIVIYIVMIVANKEMFENRLKLLKEYAVDMTAEEYLYEESEIKKENRGQLILGLIIFAVIIGASTVIILLLN